MTLDEAIKHLVETLTNPAHEWNCPECKAEHEQLLAWLKELKALKECKGDLISREALKAILSNEPNYIDDGVIFEQFEKIIDNAPTVDIWQLRQEATENALKKAEVLYGRPQGEWEDYSVDFYKCPECGYLLNKDCPHCGNKVVLPECDHRR